ncbi:MAG: nucleotidyltransferase domain-containing protein [Candidatus Nanoarchaeia archaeon]|nr:nucleotidyltransferase domain-containing protein [Candidatus Nanoarchaeia archaeon]
MLKLFIEEPDSGFSVREIARRLNQNHATILNHMAPFVKRELIVIDKTTLYPTYRANTSSKDYRLYKKNEIVFQINESGLIEHIKEKALPASIILYGSCAKGDYRKGSDIDIFVEANEAKLDLAKFEKMLGREIHVIFEQKIMNLASPLLNNVLNGIILNGFVKLDRL